MRSVKVCLVALGLVLFGVACAGPASESVNRSQPATASPVSAGTPDVMAAARTNYEKHCKECHGETGDGGVVTVDNKKLKVPSLLRGHVLTDPDSKLVKQITNGEDEMPAFKDKLTPAEIDALVNYVRKGLQKQ